MLRVFRFSAQLLGGPDLPLSFVEVFTGKPFTGPGHLKMRCALHCEFVDLINRGDPFALKIAVLGKATNKPKLTYLFFDCDATDGELDIQPLDATDNKVLTAGLKIPYGRFRLFNGDPSPLELLALEAV